MHATESLSRQGMEKRRVYRLRKPVRFFRRIGIVALIGIIVLIMAGFIKKSASEMTASPVAMPAPSGTEMATPLPEPEATPVPEPEATPILTEAPEGFVWKELLVVLDAGHGGRDPGAVSPDGPEVLEKDITLAIVRYCREMLEAEGVPVLLTRESDKALAEKVQADLDVRSAVANNAEATLFVSIHVNSLELSLTGAKDVTGMECYYAKKENLYPPVTDAIFANRLGESMAAKNGKKLNTVIENRLAVLRATKMPAVLVEVGYLSNADDLESMNSEAYRETTARGIADAILLTVADLTPVKVNGVWNVLCAEPVKTEAADG